MLKILMLFGFSLCWLLSLRANPEIESAIMEATSGLEARSSQLGVVVERLNQRGMTAVLVIHGRDGFPQGKDKITVNGLTYDIIQAATPEGVGRWQTLFLKVDSEKGIGPVPSKGASHSIGSLFLKLAEANVKLAREGLNPDKGGLEKLVERLKGAGLSAQMAKMPGNLLNLEGYQFEVVSHFGENDSSWSFSLLGKIPTSGGDTKPSSTKTPAQLVNGRVPLPNFLHIVEEVAKEMPSQLIDSSPRKGGTWEFLDETINRLRREDPRFGYNWKRGNRGDPSEDAISYFFGPGDPVQDSDQCYVIDIIRAHDSPDASPAWQDVTDYSFSKRNTCGWTPRR